jgi:quercetin dioxygenase-like cupin family protein
VPGADPGGRERPAAVEPLVRFDPRSFRWAGVAPWEYKPPDRALQRGISFAGVSRHPLVRAQQFPANWELRYFEFAPGGYSSLEKHHHTHFVVVVRGSGRVLVGDQLVACRPFDAIYVPPMTPHRWMNALKDDGEEPFGFLCPVDRDRDRPQPLDDSEWEALRANPETAPYVF